MLAAAYYITEQDGLGKNLIDSITNRVEVIQDGEYIQYDMIYAKRDNFEPTADTQLALAVAYMAHEYRVQTVLKKMIRRGDGDLAKNLRGKLNG